MHQQNGSVWGQSLTSPLVQPAHLAATAIQTFNAMRAGNADQYFACVPWAQPREIYGQLLALASLLRVNQCVQLGVGMKGSFPKCQPGGGVVMRESWSHGQTNVGKMEQLKDAQ